MCVLIRVTSRYNLTFTIEYIHNVSKTFLPLVTRPCCFDQITRGKINQELKDSSRSDGGHFDFHIVEWEPGQSAKTRGEWGSKLDDK